MKKQVKTGLPRNFRFLKTDENEQELDEQWKQAVAEGRTTHGFLTWLAEHQVMGVG